VSYYAFAEKILASGLITDPWLGGQPRFREEPMILSAGRAREMARAAEAIAEVYNELCLLVVDDPESFDSFFCLTPYQKAMWMASQPLWHAVARARRVRHEGGPPDRGAQLRYADRRGRGHRARRALATRRRDGSPYNLTYAGGRLRLFDQPVSLVVRHYKTDWWSERQSAWDDEEVPDTAPLDEPLEAILAAMLDGKCSVVNPFGAVVPQNKRAMAFMWERIHRFTPRSQEVIRDLLPPTRRLEAIHQEQLLAQKDEWVLKSDYGAEGDEVIIGKLTTPEIWQKSLLHARPGRWIVQRFFEAQDDVNYGVFVVAGEAAGFYARIQSGATDDRALSAPVLVEG
jgi:hypothetical protein